LAVFNGRLVSLFPEVWGTTNQFRQWGETLDYPSDWGVSSNP
jgi:hypothetical protein